MNNNNDNSNNASTTASSKQQQQQRRRQQYRKKKQQEQLPLLSQQQQRTSTNDDDNNNSNTQQQEQQHPQRQKQQPKKQQQQSKQQPQRQQTKNHHEQMNMWDSSLSSSSSSYPRRNILVLHGNRQTGQILLGRMNKLHKKLLQLYNIDLIAPDASYHYNDNNNNQSNTTTTTNNQQQPTTTTTTTNHSQNANANDDNDNNTRIELTWWNRQNDNYIGLEESLKQIYDLWNQHNNTNNNDIKNQPFIGVIGFSQGAKLTHFISILHQYSSQIMFPGLQFVVLVAAYDSPNPPELYQFIQNHLQENDDKKNNNTDSNALINNINIPSLHVWGMTDTLITSSQSQIVMEQFTDSICEIHDGGHYVPMKASNITSYLNFIQTFVTQQTTVNTKDYNTNNNINHNNNSIALNPIVMTTHDTTNVSSSSNSSSQQIIPNEENAQAQYDEIEALKAIYPNEITIISNVSYDNVTDLNIYQYPIRYQFHLKGSDDDDTSLWPPYPISIEIQYPYNYPEYEMPIIIPVTGKNNGIQITSSQYQAWEQCMMNVATNEIGMSCVLSIIYTTQEFFTSGQFRSITTITNTNNANETSMDNNNNNIESITTNDVTISSSMQQHDDSKMSMINIKPSSSDRIKQCNLEGLKIAERLLKIIHKHNSINSDQNTNSITNNNIENILDDKVPNLQGGNGGVWTFTIGLVGKPSAGKSTFFNTATAFARQRKKDNNDNDTDHNTSKDDTSDIFTQLQLGGATMAPHPFTTIDPNIGYCLVPAPVGSCPEESLIDQNNMIQFGNTHGRDYQGRRLIPVLLKDVAGLVPGAYQGRGRGNQFLNDLCDADVLIHVVDSSGLSDNEGNIVDIIMNNNDDDRKNSKISSTDDKNSTLLSSSVNGNNTLPEGRSSHPINDMEWIRDELIQWVFTNIMYKWETIRKKGRNKLSDMFSGYGQSSSTTWNILNAVEKYIELIEPHRDRALDHLIDWDVGDVYRLVSAFLGVRFPIVLALNKYDLPTSGQYIKDILKALPIHGTYAGIPLSAKDEMNFMKSNIERIIVEMSRTTTQSTTKKQTSDDINSYSIPSGTLQCLQSALSLRDTILVFPVMDFVDYHPMPGLSRFMTNDASLPSIGMIECIKVSGGSIPTLWDSQLKQYTATNKNKTIKDQFNNETNKDNDNSHRTNTALRDAILMKTNSTVEDLYIALKRMGALGGEFVRAEGTSDIGIPAKPIPKYQILSKKIRIIKIMTNKRSTWQK